MEPLSHRTRISFLFILVALFAIILPFSALYASGYRFKNFTLVETGGVYISAPTSDVAITINGEPVGVTSLFNKTFYINNLVPGSYVVQASLDGHYPWAKILTVEPRIVTDVSAFIVPQTLSVLELKVGTTTSATVVGVSALTLAEFKDAFRLPTTTPEVSATSTPTDARDGMDLFVENGEVFIRWARDASSTPSLFCLHPSSCESELKIKKGKESAISAVFFGAGVLYRINSGIYYSEIESRPTPLTVPVYLRRGADFRVFDGRLIVKDGASFFEVTGF